MRTKKAIQEAEQEFFDKVWYNRKQVLREKEDVTKLPGDLLINMLAAEVEIEKRYGQENLEFDDFEWGMVNGKLSALRWILGDDWDMLDT